MTIKLSEHKTSPSLLPVRRCSLINAWSLSRQVRTFGCAHWQTRALTICWKIGACCPCNDDVPAIPYQEAFAHSCMPVPLSPRH